MKESSDGKLRNNAVYQTIYQVLTTITPLITTPIVSRELGADKLGVFSYSLTIAHYFSIFCMLGIVNYGTRAIAEAHSSGKDRSQVFWNIYSIQLTMCLISIVAYILYVIIFAESKVLAYIQGLWVVTCIFDINWLFFGLEQFKVTVVRNIIIKLITVISIVFFIKKGENALFIYSLIMSGGSLVSVLSVCPFVKRFIEKRKPDFSNAKAMVKPILVLFIPVLATVVFGSIDKFMLGNLAEYSELGCYYNADRVINIPLGIINGLVAVFFPRVSSLFAQSKKDEAFGFINSSFEVLQFIAGALSFGIMGCAVEFVPIFFGDGFEECVYLIYVLAPVFSINAICIFYRMQYLVPLHFDGLYAKALIIGTISNVVLNYFLISEYKAIGAALATLISQIVVMIVQFSKHENISGLNWLKQILFYSGVGLLMFVIMRLFVSFIKSYMTNNISILILEIMVGGCVYVFITLLCSVFTHKSNVLTRTLKMIKK